MANSWTKNDYNRSYGEDDRPERRYRQERAYGMRGRRFDEPQHVGGRYEEEYGYEADYDRPSSYEYRRMYGGGMNRDDERDARFRDVARFERESNFGGERDPEWHPYGGRPRRHMRERDMQHGDYPRAREYEREWDRETDRGAWNRSRDEVSSWFGDEEARRRRRMDEMRDDWEDQQRDYRARRHGRYE
jgi:hypothetical protein